MLDTAANFSKPSSALVGEARQADTGRRAGSLLLATQFASLSGDLRAGCSIHCSCLERTCSRGKRIASAGGHLRTRYARKRRTRPQVVSAHTVYSWTRRPSEPSRLVKQAQQARVGLSQPRALDRAGAVKVETSRQVRLAAKSALKGGGVRQACGEIPTFCRSDGVGT